MEPNNLALFSLIVSVLALVVSTGSLTVAFYGARRSLKYVNVNTDLIYDMGTTDDGTSYSRAFVKLLIANRGKDATSIHKAMIFLLRRQVIFYRRTRVITLVEEGQEPTVDYLDSMSVELRPGQTGAFTSKHPALSRVGDRIEENLGRYRLVAAVWHSQRDRPELVRLRRLERDLSGYEERFRRSIAR